MLWTKLPRRPLENEERQREGRRKAFLCIPGLSQLPRLGTVPAPEILLAHPPAPLPACSWEHSMAPSDPIMFLICPGIHGDVELSQLILPDTAGMVPRACELCNIEYFKNPGNKH